jgi:transcriptional regulator with XRE-family HTH domain
MERIESINRDRIRWCADERGLSIDQVAAESAIPEKALARLMDDGIGLTFAQLRKLADYFGRGVLFFLDQGPVDEERAHTVQYRTLTGQKPELAPTVRKLIERVERQRELYLALREELHAEDYPHLGRSASRQTNPPQQLPLFAVGSASGRKTPLISSDRRLRPRASSCFAAMGTPAAGRSIRKARSSVSASTAMCALSSWSGNREQRHSKPSR